MSKIIILEKILPQKARTVKTYCSNAASRILVSDHYSGFQSYETQVKLYQIMSIKMGRQRLTVILQDLAIVKTPDRSSLWYIGTDGELIWPNLKPWLFRSCSDYGFCRYLKGKEKLVIWLNAFLHYVVRSQKSLQVTPQFGKGSITALKVESMLISRKAPCKNAWNLLK